MEINVKIKIFQKGFNYSQDGTGNRLVYHLQGCNMNCPWCANPEGIHMDGTLIINSEHLLESVCPFGAIKEKSINRALCSTCKLKPCIYKTRNKGIQYSCVEYELDEIIDEVMRSTALFYDGGGITLTGGEPTLQFEAVYSLLIELKKNGIHTAIETNAAHPKLETLFPLIDLLIMDFKHYDNTRHTEFTSIGNTRILENIKKALKKHKNILIRIPLIKGFNASEADITKFAAFFKEQPLKNACFEFLSYHEYGKTKWFQCGMNYQMKDAFINTEVVYKFEKLFLESGLKVVHT